MIATAMNIGAGRIKPSLQMLLPAFCAAVWGLGLSRVLYELFFPQAVWLGRPAAALGLALLAGAGGWWLARAAAQRLGLSAALAPFLPLLLNLQAIVQPQGSTLLSRLLFLGSLWLALVVALLLIWPHRQRIAGMLLLAGALLPIYLLTMGHSVGRADTFEFQVVIPKLGIVHPTGYPLYLLLGKLFTFLPLGSVAWRINLASVAFGTAAAALVFLSVWQVTRRSLPALLAALLLALGSTFWSQAVEAEVYALHAVLVGAVLWAMASLQSRDWGLGIGDWRLEIGDRGLGASRLARGDWRLGPWRLMVLLYLLVGLGLTNHLTTIILLPGVVLATAFVFSDRRRTSAGQSVRREEAGEKRQSFIPNLQSLASSLPYLLAAFLLPLLLYAYLPIRWAAVNGEPMGVARFVDWVIGGRFQGALRLDAFLNDPQRYGVVGRLLLAEWQPAWLLLPAAAGFLWLAWRHRRLGLILALTFAGYVFYALSYYVPDLAVFLLPAQLVLALWWGVGVGVTVRRLETGDWRLEAGSRRVVAVVLAAGVIGLLLNGVATRWAAVDRSQADGGAAWAAAVLAQPLDRGAAILADSEKFPPLYYLQQAEGVRPDLDIMVLPDEAAYRAELGARLAAGQTVYLARFLPGLEGQYHLRSAGPLLEVARQPLEALPERVTPDTLDFDGIQLLGYMLQWRPSWDGDVQAAALTLFWQAGEALRQPLHVYTRWLGEGYEGAPIPAGGQHPANNSYPTVAWAPGEIVPDYHLLPRPLLGEAQTLALQVAWAPPFSAPPDLAWQTVTTATVLSLQALPQPQALQAQVGGALLEGVQVPGQTRPQQALALLLRGCGDDDGLQISLLEEGGRLPDGAGEVSRATCGKPFILRETVDALREPGAYALWALAAQEGNGGGGARCHWLAAPSSGCRLATVTIGGAALPPGATNFDDKIALTALEATERDLTPGGKVTVDVTWQALAPMAENYTVFVQVVDEQDRIVGQVDTWPRQGTSATSQWRPGEVVRDTYTVQLGGDATPGSRYRLLVGWYLLGTQQRLPVLDEGGAIVEDRVVVELGS